MLASLKIFIYIYILITITPKNLAHTLPKHKGDNLADRRDISFLLKSSQRSHNYSGKLERGHFSPDFGINDSRIPQVRISRCLALGSRSGLVL